LSIYIEPQLRLNQKLEEATAGLTPQYIGRLKKVSKDNALAISDFILSSKAEINLSDSYRRLIITVLGKLSEFHNQTAFRDLSREDILSYLNSLRISEVSDPLHGWIGTYDNYLTVITKFFKWLYSPDIERNKRPKPNVVENFLKQKNLQ
jgi:integrase/recombinase XerD